jgi:type II secretory pathway pseudopilin PulG
MQERAANAKIHNDLKSLEKVIESYRTTYGTFPNTGGGWNYSASNPTNYVPGIAAEYNTRLPQLTKGALSGSNSYIYRSNAAGTEYKVMRLNQNPTISVSEQATVPDSMRDYMWAANQDRYGYWSPGGNNL